MHPTRAAHERRIPTSLGRITALSLTLGATLLGPAAAAQANALDRPTSSPGARATVPMTIGVSGSADPSATLRVYARPGSGSCVLTGGQPVPAAGSTEVIAQQPATGPFSFTGTYTPAVEGQHSVCAFLFGPSPGSASVVTSGNFTVGPAPPPPPATGTNSSPTAPGATGTTPRRTRCVVPTLKGRTYLGARTLIRRAGCSVGTVYRPGPRTARAERARGRVLRVVLQYPKPRSVRRLNSRLMLRLAYVAPRRSSR
jgi:hypothetical protein